MLQFFAEIVVRSLFEAVVQVAGYWTAWLLVPTLTFGFVRVAANDESVPRRQVKRLDADVWRARHRRFVLSPDTAGFVGTVLLIVIAIAVIVALRHSQA